MIRYHGGPCTPLDAAIELWTRRHALVSFARPEQTDLALSAARWTGTIATQKNLEISYAEQPA